MTEEGRLEARASVRSFMSALADWISGLFPHHAAAIRQELGRPNMTTDRWNRIACLLSSLYSVPGAGLSPTEHDTRNVALAAIAISQKMAAASLGCTRDPDGCMDFAAWQATEVTARMATCRRV
jgi:hypothetical protein